MGEKRYELENISVEIKTIESEGLLLCKVKGNLETYNSSAFLEIIENELSRNIINKIILDLSELFYISSTGIGSFTTLLISCKNKGTLLILQNILPKVMSVFDILGFSSFFTME